MKEKYVLSIKAEDRPGLLHLITGMIEKRLVRINSLSLAPTDVHDIVLITVELMAGERELTTLALKLENIVEVFAVEARHYDRVLCLRVAYFKLKKEFLSTPRSSVLQKYGAVIVNLYPDTVLVAQYGSDAAIRRLYNELEGPCLVGFSQSGLITDSKLIGEGESSVINRLAA